MNEERMNQLRALLDEKWGPAGTDTHAPKTRKDDNICRCILRARIRERLGITGSKAKLTLIQGGRMS